MSGYGVQRCQITEVVFYPKALVNDTLVGLERILDYASVGLEMFNCILYFVIGKMMDMLLVRTSVSILTD